jgi:8-oxo-dGTP pyrophosphatase MutT (NUDIX family)
MLGLHLMTLLLAVVAVAALPLLMVSVALVRTARAPDGVRLPFAKWTSAGGAVIDQRGRIALVRQRDRRGRWRWTLPKGRMEPGETAEATALREVYEESGLRARILRPIILHEGRLHFTHFFEMALERDDGVHDGETKEVRFVPFVEAVALVRSQRDLRVLRRLVEIGTRVVGSSASPDSVRE